METEIIRKKIKDLNNTTNRNKKVCGNKRVASLARYIQKSSYVMERHLTNESLDAIKTIEIIRELKRSMVLCSYFIGRCNRVSLEQRLQFMKTQAYIAHILLSREE